MSRNARDLAIGANSNAAKMNGKPPANGKLAQAGSKKKAQSGFDALVDALYDDNRKKGLTPQQQRQKVKEYLSAQMPATGRASNGVSDSSQSEDHSDDQEYSDTSSESEEMTEYTMSSSSSPEVPPTRRTNPKAASEDANNNKVAPIKNKTAAEKAGPAAGNPRIQRRVTMAGALVHTEPEATKSGALHCPLKRKSVASCPLPPKAKSPNPTQAAKSKASAGAVVAPRVVQEDVKNEPGPSAALAVPASGRKGSKSPAGGRSSSKPGTSAGERSSSKPGTSAGDSAAEGSSGAKPRTSKAAKAKSTGSAGDGDAAGDAEGAIISPADIKKEEEPKTKAKDCHKVNSIEEGRRMLQWVINPLQPDEFFSSFWEKNACQVQRQNSKYFSELISFRMIDEMLIRHHLEFTTNIDVTSYKDGVRETLNPEGRATPPVVWGFYGEGCSIRILNPSTYLAGLRQVCATLQEFFHCLVGANVYLTPPNSQGFAPHYDDIEAFVLQVEGRKRWRLYMPVKPNDILARHSSGNFDQSELGEAIFDEVLEAGDVLYFPRGTVHQAITEQNQHSLHITLSVYQQQAYANLLENLMPMVLKNAVEKKMALRRGLPLHTWQNLGLANGGEESRSRSALIQGIQQMVQKYLVPTEEQIDAAVDQLAKKFQHEALPPTILPEERERTVFGSRSQTNAKGQCLCDYEITQQTSIRLLRANIVRLVAEEGVLRLYYYVDNALEYCKYEANFMEIEPSEAGAVELLLHTYPAYIKVSDLPLKSSSRRTYVATALWERGILMTEKPFK